MISLIFPDDSMRQFEDGATGRDVAAAISKSLAKQAVVMLVNDQLCDLSDPVPDGAHIAIITRDDPRALALIRHDAAHVMAEAVQSLFPGTQVTIGPVIDNGFFYDFARDEPFTTEDLPKIEAKMREIIARKAPFTKEVWSRDKAKEVFSAMGEHYKVELVDAIPEGEEVKIYRQGDWFDLCRGPHMAHTGQVGTAFKLMKVAGAYWRGDSNNPMLTRIYGTAWASDKELKAYLTQLEEAEKRDHRKLAREMDLFHFQEEGPGSVFWHQKGWTLFQNLIGYMRRRNQAAGYEEVNTPDMLERGLWEASGHWDKFGEHMFTTETPDERVFALKPMNCPGHVQLFKNGLKSYRDLPAKLSEFGKVHRYEPSGALHGLMRVRSFTQDDAHIFVTEDQITEQCLAVHNLLLSIYADFGFEEIVVKFSDRPDQRVGDDAVWDKAEAALKTAVEAAGGAYSFNPGEGAFYGPKLEYVLRDTIGRDWQCGTLQVDLNLPGRLGAFYIGADGAKHTPVMLHRAIFGSLERFTGILIEHHGGHFPLWLAPLQAVIATVTCEAEDYARHVLAEMTKAGLRATLDARNEKINYKVREHSLAKAPIIAACGQREAESGTLCIRRLGSKAQTTLPLYEAIAAFGEEGMAPDLKRAGETLRTH